MFHRAAQQSETDTLIFLQIEEVFGEFAQQEKFADVYKAFLERVYKNEPVLSISEGVSGEKLAVTQAGQVLVTHNQIKGELTITLLLSFYDEKKKATRRSLFKVQIPLQPC